MVVIEKIKTWKIFINKQPFVFDTINGLVKSIYIFPDIIKCEKKFILGWNVYSLIRFILENNTEPLPVVGNLVEVLLTISLTSKNAK